MAKIAKEIEIDGENVIVDTTNMSSEHISMLKIAVEEKGFTENVIFWP